MSDIPILFSAPMVRAILDGRKTQTRRIMKPQPELLKMGLYHVSGFGGGLIGVPEEDVSRESIDYVQWQVGDRLWVREAWRAWWEYNEFPPSKIPSGADVQYVADNPLSTWDTRFRQSIHMPRWASRLTLIVTSVKVERLQKVTNEEAIAEGVGPLCHPLGREDLIWVGTEMACKSPYLAFRDLWTEINGADSWAANPWVVALTFQVHRCNIDSLPDAGKAA